jgi:hypothetical protein
VGDGDEFVWNGGIAHAANIPRSAVFGNSACSVETSHRSAFVPIAKIVEKLLDLASWLDRFRLSMEKQNEGERP